MSQALGPALAGIIAIVGWAVVSAGNDRREGRKELRGRLDKVRDQVLKFEDLAHEFFQKSVADGALTGMKIKRESQQLGWIIKSLSQIDPGFACSEQLREFRQKVMLGDFESAARVPRLANDALFLEISQAGQQLMDALEGHFNRKYPHQSGSPGLLGRLLGALRRGPD